MAKMTLEQLGPVLRERRGGRGVREVAQEIGISYATLSRIETGKLPDLDTFAKICQWLKIDGGEILGCAVSDAAVASTQDSSLLPEPQFHSVHFRADKTVSPKTAQHLGVLILTVQRAIEEEFAA